MTIMITERLHQLVCPTRPLRFSIHVLFCFFILLFSASGYAQKVVANELFDARLESALDDYLALSDESTVKAKAALDQVVNQLTDKTPLLTRVRALGYYASEFAYDEQFEKAYALLDQLKVAAEKSGSVDAQAEILASRIDFLVMEGKRGDAFLLVPKLERLLDEAQVARIRYYGHNLLSSIYSDWERFDSALQHLLQAQQALGDMDTKLDKGRRLYLLSRIADIQIALEQWDAAILTVEQTVQSAVDNGFRGLAYDLWFTKYYAQISLGDYEQALSSLERAYQLAQQMEASFQEVIILNNFGDTYLKLGEYDQARSHLLEARAKAAELDFTAMETTIDFNLGFIAVKQGDSLGIMQMERATELFRDSLSSQELEVLLGEMAEGYETVGDFEAAARILKERIELKERILKDAQLEKMTELQAVYKSRDDAQQIELLEQQNELKAQIIKNNDQQRMVWLLFAAFTAVCMLLVMALYRKSKRSNRQLSIVNRQLAEQSLKDPLTGLWNRRALQELMLKRSEKTSPGNDGLLLLDIDHFKRINDKYGHAAGDKVLSELSQRLQKMCRESDTLVRWGGEEFLFYVSDIDLSQLQQLAERVLVSVGACPVNVNGERIQITTSLGFVQLPFSELSEDIVDWERALQIADMALYNSKARGRNRACGVTRLKVDYELARRALEHDLQLAEKNQWVELTIIEGQ